MSIWPKFFSILLLFGAGFLFGYHMGAPVPTGEGVVAVKLANDSGKSIRTVHLSHDNGSVDVKDLLDRSATMVRFYAPRETSYRLEVTFDDGDFLESGVRHIESRQDAVETIKQLEIVPEFHVLK